jgi:hypothetical protein
MLRRVAFRRLLKCPCHWLFAHNTFDRRQHSGKHPSYSQLSKDTLISESLWIINSSMNVSVAKPATQSEYFRSLHYSIYAEFLPFSAPPHNTNCTVAGCRSVIARFSRHTTLRWLRTHWKLEKASHTQRYFRSDAVKLLQRSENVCHIVTCLNYITLSNFKSVVSHGLWFVVCGKWNCALATTCDDELGEPTLHSSQGSHSCILYEQFKLLKLTLSLFDRYLLTRVFLLLNVTVLL